ncbi:MAG: CCA tRNA nucleotidyltransferase [Ruminococcaceae bacterium]|nr:CCA tRNA nucleotidyltransferase [Oscillospiraceae bacterium]
MNFSIPKEINNALLTLNNAGFEAYIVGGCVRDMLLNKIPQDYDITTSATPEEIIKLFPHTIPTGIKHGTVTVIFDNNERTEITTFRCETAYSDNRHPERVSFVKTIEEDLSRRDFTVNAMAFCDEKGFKDPFGGLNDLNKKTLRTVGEPYKRFSEDALRILRLFRFSAQLGFSAEKNTFEQALKLSNNLCKISRERIRDEFIKTLCSQNPADIAPLIKTNCLAFLGIKKDHTVFENLELLKADPIPRFAYYCFINNLSVLEIAQNLRLSKAFARSCENVCALLKNKIPANKVEIKQVLRTITKSDFEIYLQIISKFNDTNTITESLKEIECTGEPYSLSQLKINGDDLLKLGIKDKQIKLVLENLLTLVIKHPEFNDKNILIEQVTK